MQGQTSLQGRSVMMQTWCYTPVRGHLSILPYHLKANTGLNRVGKHWKLQYSQYILMFPLHRRRAVLLYTPGSLGLAIIIQNVPEVISIFIQ